MSNFFVNHYAKKFKSMKEIEVFAYKFFQNKYFFNNYFQGACVINNIIFNEKTHLVSKFKDYLIEDDLSEFLKRYYRKDESLIRLPKYYEYYDAYSKIFPNYTALRESKYIYKNLHKKQKMIDLQQEMEESNERKKQELEELLKNNKLRLNEPTHQRKKNQQDVIFNSDIYNSIIKQSQDLYSILFGIDKSNDEKESSIINLTELVKLIDDSSKAGVNYNNVIEVPKVNYTNNKKKTTNSSLLTKQSTINSSNIHKKGRKFENFYKKNNDILIGLKKCMNEKKSITSNSLLSNRENKNELLNSRKKSVPFSKLILSKEKPINKDDNKQKKIKINVNNQNYINFLKEKLSKISSKYCTINQGINENRKTILTDRESNHNRYKTLHSENSNKYKIYDLILENNNKNNDNKKSKKISKSKLLMDIGYYTRTHSKNSSVHKNKRYSTNSTNTIICETERRPSRVIKFYNKQKDKNLQVNNNNNLISFNLKEIRELMREKNMKEKICQTERDSKLNSYKMNKKISFKSNKAKNNLFKKLSSFKTTNPSIDNKTKINKNILLSQKKISGLKSIRKTLPTTPIMNEKSKINRSKIFKMCQEKKLFLNLESNNNINKTMEKENNHETEGKEVNNDLFISQNNAFNTLSAIKGIKIKNFSTSINLGKPNINRNINKKKISIIINKTKSNTSRNNRKQKNKSDEKDLKIKNYKRIISKEISPNKFKNVISSNGTEKKKAYLIMKSDLKTYIKTDMKYQNKLKNKAL